MFLFAEGVAEEAGWLVGSSGWGGAGLLGLVLAWLLFKHLPAKDTQLTNMIDKHTLAMQNQTNDFNKVLAEKRSEFTIILNEQRHDFRESLKEVTQHCERETSHLADSMKGDLHTLSTIVKELAEAVSSLRDQG